MSLLSFDFVKLVQLLEFTYWAALCLCHSLLLFHTCSFLFFLVVINIWVLFLRLDITILLLSSSRSSTVFDFLGPTLSLIVLLSFGSSKTDALRLSLFFNFLVFLLLDLQRLGHFGVSLRMTVKENLFWCLPEFCDLDFKSCSLDRIRKFLKINTALVSDGVENIQVIEAALFDSKNEIYPKMDVFTHIGTFKGLFVFL